MIHCHNLQWGPAGQPLTPTFIAGQLRPQTSVSSTRKQQTMTPALDRVSRVEVLQRMSGRLTEAVPGTPEGMDEGRPGRLVDLGPQP